MMFKSFSDGIDENFNKNISDYGKTVGTKSAMGSAVRCVSMDQKSRKNKPIFSFSIETRNGFLQMGRVDRKSPHCKMH